MTSLQPSEFWLYYAAFTLLLVVFFLRTRPRRGMRLRLNGWRARSVSGNHAYRGKTADLNGKVTNGPFTVVKSWGERPLNVVFNYNGHSWDAYEVLGLPAGSSPEKVEQAYQESLARVDAGSRPFMQAAYQAIMGQMANSKASSDS